jgi:hypothetical protein
MTAITPQEVFERARLLLAANDLGSQAGASKSTEIESVTIH